MQTTSNSCDSIDFTLLEQRRLPVNDIDSSPEVTEVIAKMPSWVMRGVLHLIVAFILVALVWASLSSVDIVAVGRGVLIPEGNVKPVQASSFGAVQSLFVKEGDKVERGDVLVQLDASEMRNRVHKLRQELQTSQSQLMRMKVDRPLVETLEQQNRIARLQSELGTAERMLQNSTITAPVSGVITTLSVRSGREVLQPGQTVATIAPTDVPLVVEAQLPNKDIAFMKDGLTAKLKFDAFPYQDYGIVEGTVIDISPDAQVSKESGSLYKITIALTGSSKRELPLRTGLVVTAEIITERRSVLSFLFEPVRKLKSDMGLH